MTLTEFALRLLCAFGVGVLIGIERQWRHKQVGLRTILLVSVGSALFVLLSINLTQDQGDVTRIVSQVVTGIGFLGAGIIFKDGINIHGLTTAATVWCSAALGCTAASGYYEETLIGTIAVMSINWILMPLDNWISNVSKKHGGK